MYNIENIPAKIYFKILESGDVTLLSKTETDLEVLNNAWIDLNDTYSELNKTHKTEKIFNLSTEIQSLSCKYNAISDALIVLKEFQDDELLQLVNNYGYKISKENQLKDIEVVERNISGITLKIKRYTAELGKLQPKEKQDNNTSFDELYMSYIVFIEFPFKDANSVTLLEFSSLEKQVLSKVNSLKKNG